MHVTPVCKYYFDFDLVFHNHFISATAFGWGGAWLLACEQAPVGDSRVQSRANGMSRERSGEEGVRRGACRHSIDAAVP